MNVEIDLRGLPVWERPGPVVEAFKRLPVGKTLTLLTENEPRGLGARLAETLPAQARIEPLRVARGQWQVLLTRVEGDHPPVTIRAALQRVAAFSPLPDRALKRLASQARERTLHKGRTAAADGAKPFVGIVWEGIAAVTAPVSEKRTRRLFDVYPFELFGDVELFDGGFPVGRTVALTQSVRYVAIPRDAVRALCAKHPDVALALASVCAQRVRLLAEALTGQVGKTFVARVAAALLPYAIAERGMAHAGEPLPGMTQTQLASAAGTVKETANRAVAELEARGALRREAGHIVFLDRSLLLEIARSS